MALKDIEGFSPLEAFLHPKQAVQDALEYPSVILVAVLVVLPWIISFATASLIGLKFDFASSAKKELILIILFFIEAGLIFAIAKGFGNKDRKLFEGILSAYALTKLAAVLLAIILAFVLFLNPQVAGLVNDWNSGLIQQSDLVENVANLVFSNSIFGWITTLVVLFFVVWIGLLSLYLRFLTVHKSTKTSIFGSIIVMIVVFAVSFVLNSALGFLFFLI